MNFQAARCRVATQRLNRKCQQITHSVEFVGHLDQFLVHLDPDVFTLKHRRRERVRERWVDSDVSSDRLEQSRRQHLDFVRGKTLHKLFDARWDRKCQSRKNSMDFEFTWVFQLKVTTFIFELCFSVWKTKCVFVCLTRWQCVTSPDHLLTFVLQTEINNVLWRRTRIHFHFDIISRLIQPMSLPSLFLSDSTFIHFTVILVYLPCLWSHYTEQFDHTACSRTHGLKHTPPPTTTTTTTTTEPLMSRQETDFFVFLSVTQKVEESLRERCLRLRYAATFDFKLSFDLSAASSSSK